MTDSKKYISKSLVLNFSDLPFEGLEIETEVLFKELTPPKDELQGRSDELNLIFADTIQVKAQVLPVASKVDLRGGFKTELKGECDRCTVDVKTPVDGSLTMFLMPREQFSTHDRPGGKVIHGPTRDVKPSRHHSVSKAPVLTEAADDHEDTSFGAFDGEKIDIRPILRENLILQIPMSTLCSDSCKGLCLECGENVNSGKCVCKQGPTLVAQEEIVPLVVSPFASALQKKLKTS